MAHLPSAENRYPAYPGIPVAERHVARHCAGGDHVDPVIARDAVHAYRTGSLHPTASRLLKRPTKVTRNAVVHARVEHGRWLADCPWCRNAIFAPVTDPRFFCPECMNVAVDGEFVPVIVPSEEHRTQITALLLKVPDEKCRNWLPHETVEELAQQVHAFIAEHQHRIDAALELAMTMTTDEFMGR